MSTIMSDEEREAFLGDVHVAIISISEEGRGPLTVPVWYAYQPGGEVHIWTGGNSHKARLMRKQDRFSLCVQQENQPYKYVSVEGPVVSIEPVDLDRDLRPLVYRYLGPVEGDEYLESLGGQSAGTGDVLIRMKPEHWLSADYSD